MKKVNVDGIETSIGILIGDATEQSDGKYRCLARVGSALCLVEVIIKSVVDTARRLDDLPTERDEWVAFLGRFGLSLGSGDTLDGKNVRSIYNGTADFLFDEKGKFLGIEVMGG